MPRINRNALMPYTAKQMYDIVNGVDLYQEFLPWCASSQVIEQTESSMKATVLMKKGKLNHSFTTQNDLIDGEKIHMNLVNGPFKILRGDWIFTHFPEQGSKIELNLEFEFSNRLVGLLIGPIFTQIANTLVDAFCQRAHQLYKK